MKIRPGDAVQPRCTDKTTRVVRIHENLIQKTRTFLCDDGNAYAHGAVKIPPDRKLAEKS